MGAAGRRLAFMAAQPSLVAGSIPARAGGIRGNRRGDQSLRRGAYQLRGDVAAARSTFMHASWRRHDEGDVLRSPDERRVVPRSRANFR